MAYCYTCGCGFHPLGIARHRAMHRDRKENCVIRFDTYGVVRYPFADEDAAKKRMSAETQLSLINKEGGKKTDVCLGGGRP